MSSTIIPGVCDTLAFNYLASYNDRAVKFMFTVVSGFSFKLNVQQFVDCTTAEKNWQDPFIQRTYFLNCIGGDSISLNEFEVQALIAFESNEELFEQFKILAAFKLQTEECVSFDQYTQEDDGDCRFKVGNFQPDYKDSYYEDEDEEEQRDHDDNEEEIQNIDWISWSQSQEKSQKKRTSTPFIHHNIRAPLSSFQVDNDECPSFKLDHIPVTSSVVQDDWNVASESPMFAPIIDSLADQLKQQKMATRKVALEWIQTMTDREFETRLLHPLNSFKLPDFPRSVWGAEDHPSGRPERHIELEWSKTEMLPEDPDNSEPMQKNFACFHRDYLRYMTEQDFIEIAYADQGPVEYAILGGSADFSFTRLEMDPGVINFDASSAI